MFFTLLKQSFPTLAGQYLHFANVTIVITANVITEVHLRMREKWADLVCQLASAIGQSPLCVGWLTTTYCLFGFVSLVRNSLHAPRKPP